MANDHQLETHQRMFSSVMGAATYMILILALLMTGMALFLL